jgi:Zn-dependent peptidase ImmA (M78 family)
MLHRVLESVGLDAHTCAGLLGFNPALFSEWSAGQRPVPESVLPMLSAVFGVSNEVLRAGPKAAYHFQNEDITPAIWYRVRGPELINADRECVILIRQLGHFLNELESVTRQRSLQWKTLFESIRESTDLQAAPREQGRNAARMFRESTSLGHGAKGVGEVLRGVLRSLGVLVFETPLKDSQVEGCSFYVGTQAAARPCIFANTHHVGWFRRNMVLMHEVGHSIFESALVGASLDFLNRADAGDPLEIRAQAFAQECLLPKSVLMHTSQANGVKWANPTPRALARLVAETHVEKQSVVYAALDVGLISPDAVDALLRMDIATELHEISNHALSTDEFLELIGAENAQSWIGKRTTTLTPRPLRLPVGYVNTVVQAYRDSQISKGKAAEYLMVDDATFIERFGEIYEEVEA